MKNGLTPLVYWDTICAEKKVGKPTKTDHDNFLLEMEEHYMLEGKKELAQELGKYEYYGRYEFTQKDLDDLIV